MTSISVGSRRRFIAGLGAASAGAFAHAAAEPNNSCGAPSSVPAGQPASSEYLLSPGLIHLNTASLGATPRVVLDRTLAAWRELESSPVLMAYGGAGNTVLSAVEAVRKRAAGFLGCEQDEVLITPKGPGVLAGPGVRQAVTAESTSPPGRSAGGYLCCSCGQDACAVK